MSFIDLAREPAFHIRLLAGFAIKKSEARSSLIVASPFGEVPFGRYEKGFKEANVMLEEGASLADLRDKVIQVGGVHQASTYLVQLQRMFDWGLFEFPLIGLAGEGELAVIRPQREGFLPALAADVPQAAQLDHFALLRKDNGAWLLESPLVGARFIFSSLSTLEAPLVRRALYAAGFLQIEQPKVGPHQTALAQWEFHDLLFHAHNRRGWHRDPFGGLFPFIDEIEPLPAVRPPWPGARISLPSAPDGADGEPFALLLERRRSERFYDEDHPISLDDLGALLDRAVRIRSSESIKVSNFMNQSTSFEITRRPYPNGGASYELEIYPVVDRCEGLESGLYHYDASSHELVHISGRTDEIEHMFVLAKAATMGMANPQIVLAITARFARVMWKYKSIAYGVILRNTGALYQTLYLAATELGLSPCGIGSGDSALFARATGLDPVVESTVGDFILGGRPKS